MLDSDIQHLLDTVFNVASGTTPPDAAQPDIPALRKAAEEEIGRAHV